MRVRNCKTGQTGFIVKEWLSPFVEPADLETDNELEENPKP